MRRRLNVPLMVVVATLLVGLLAGCGTGDTEQTGTVAYTPTASIPLGAMQSGEAEGITVADAEVRLEDGDLVTALVDLPPEEHVKLLVEDVSVRVEKRGEEGTWFIVEVLE